MKRVSVSQWSGRTGSGPRLTRLWVCSLPVPLHNTHIVRCAKEPEPLSVPRGGGRLRWTHYRYMLALAWPPVYRVERLAKSRLGGAVWGAGTRLDADWSNRRLQKERVQPTTFGEGAQKHCGAFTLTAQPSSPSPSPSLSHLASG